MDGGSRPRGSASGNCPVRSAYRGKASPHLFTSEVWVYKPENDSDDADYWAKTCSGCGLAKRSEGTDPRRPLQEILTDA